MRYTRAFLKRFITSWYDVSINENIVEFSLILLQYKREPGAQLFFLKLTKFPLNVSDNPESVVIFIPLSLMPTIVALVGISVLLFMDKIGNIFNNNASKISSNFWEDNLSTSLKLFSISVAVEIFWILSMEVWRTVIIVSSIFLIVAKTGVRLTISPDTLFVLKDIWTLSPTL